MEAEQLNVSDAFLTVPSALSSLPPERLPAPCPAACVGRGPGRRGWQAAIWSSLRWGSAYFPGAGVFCVCLQDGGGSLGVAPPQKFSSSHRVTLAGGEHRGQAGGFCREPLRGSAPSRTKDSDWGEPSGQAPLGSQSRRPWAAPLPQRRGPGLLRQYGTLAPGVWIEVQAYMLKPDLALEQTGSWTGGPWMGQ